jgi:hypothetical protein
MRQLQAQRDEAQREALRLKQELAKSPVARPALDRSRTPLALPQALIKEARPGQPRPPSVPSTPLAKAARAVGIDPSSQKDPSAVVRTWESDSLPQPPPSLTPDPKRQAVSRSPPPVELGFAVLSPATEPPSSRQATAPARDTGKSPSSALGDKSPGARRLADYSVQPGGSKVDRVGSVRVSPQKPPGRSEP